MQHSNLQHLQRIQTFHVHAVRLDDGIRRTYESQTNRRSHRSGHRKRETKRYADLGQRLKVTQPPPFSLVTGPTFIIRVLLL